MKWGWALDQHWFGRNVMSAASSPNDDQDKAGLSTVFSNMGMQFITMDVV